MTKALEEQVAHLARVVEELSDFVAKQDSELRHLTQVVGQLAQKTEEREPGNGGIIFSDERPPHY